MMTSVAFVRKPLRYRRAESIKQFGDGVRNASRMAEGDVMVSAIDGLQLHVWQTGREVCNETDRCDSIR